MVTGLILIFIGRNLGDCFTFLKSNNRQSVENLNSSEELGDHK